MIIPSRDFKPSSSHGCSLSRRGGLFVKPESIQILFKSKYYALED